MGPMLRLLSPLAAMCAGVGLAMVLMAAVASQLELPAAAVTSAPAR